MVVGGGASQLRAADSLVLVVSRESGGASGWELGRGRHGPLQQGRGVRGRVLGRGQFAGALRLLVHDQLGLHHAVSLQPLGVDGGRVGGRGEGGRAKVLHGARRGGVWGDDLGQGDGGGAASQGGHWGRASPRSHL